MKEKGQRIGTLLRGDERRERGRRLEHVGIRDWVLDDNVFELFRQSRLQDTADCCSLPEESTMTLVLGINRTQDASVCLMQDSHLLWAVQKERLTRRKHDWGRPR